MIGSPNQAINPEVSAVFDSYPENIREKLLFLRSLIYETAAKLGSVGELEETLKWGEPSYLATKSRLSSTIELPGRFSDRQDQGSAFQEGVNKT